MGNLNLATEQAVVAASPGLALNAMCGCRAARSRWRALDRRLAATIWPTGRAAGDMWLQKGCGSLHWGRGE